jgi:hypothetical protein
VETVNAALLMHEAMVFWVGRRVNDHLKQGSKHLGIEHPVAGVP